jgi:prepilin-type N-terminal cleavage/methylation domain-containing protein
MFRCKKIKTAGAQPAGGYTMVELLAAMSVTAVLALIALPVSHELMASYYRQAALQDLTANLRRARDEAAAHGARCALSVATDGRNYRLFVDYSPYATPPETDRQLLHRSLPKGITLEPPQTFLFDARGFLVDGSGTSTSADFSLLFEDTAYVNGHVYPSGITQY